MSLMPNEPQSIGRTLDTGLKLFKSSWKKAFLLAILRSLVWLAFIVIAGYSIFQRTGGLEMDPLMMAGILPGLALDFALFVILAILVSVLLSAATMVLMDETAKGKSPSMVSLLQEGLARTLHLSGGYILFTLGLGLITTALVTVGTIGSAAMEAGWLSIITTLMAVIAAIWISILWVVFDYFIVIDNVGIFKCFGRSKQVVQDNWWRSLAIISILYILYYVLYFILSLIPEIALSFLMPDIGGEEEVMGFILLNFAISMGLSLLIYAALAPILPAVQYALFKDLKLRKGGEDLAGKIASLSPAVSNTSE